MDGYQLDNFGRCQKLLKIIIADSTGIGGNSNFN